MSVSLSPMLIWVLQWSQCFKIRVSQHWGKRGHVTVRAKVWEVNLKNCLENSREMVSVSTICDEYWSLLSTFITRGVFPDVLFQNVPRASYAGQATNKHIMCFKSISKWVRRYLVTGGLLLRILGGGVPPVFLNPDPFSDQKNVIFHTHFKTWGPFLERSGNFSSPNANFELRTSSIVARFLAHKPVSFASFTDTFIVSFSKLLKIWCWMQTRQT